MEFMVLIVCIAAYEIVNRVYEHKETMKQLELEKHKQGS